MSEIERRFHEAWLGMVQPVEGLVVSIPVLIEAQCMERQPPHAQAKLIDLCPPRRKSDAGDEGFTIGSLPRLLAELLGHTPESFDTGSALPEELTLYVPEGRQTLAPTMALRKISAPVGSASTSGDAPSADATPTATADSTPASRAGARYEMLVWQLPTGLDLDKPESVTGTWDYPPAAKFDRLLRHCRVPIGLLTDDEVVRLVYAPHGESSGAITFRLDDMVSVGGRPILDAFVMLLSANRFFGVEQSRSLPAILVESRKRQANVTNDLADQVFDALQILLRGFEAAAERDGRDLLDDALAREGDHLYSGLLTVLLRLVFVLYAEDRGLLPVEHPIYEKHYSLLALFESLQHDRDAWPDSMPRRFGAWGRLVAIFRAVFLGVDHAALHMPPRRGNLFDPHRFPFLEGWGPVGASPVSDAGARALVRVPTVDDETVFRVLERLLLFEGQRLSYRALDVEQIGSVYEGLMGFHVVRMPADAVCTRPDRLWLAPADVLAVAAGQRPKWIKENVGLSAAHAEKLAGELKSATETADQLDALAKFAAGGRGADPASQRAKKGQLVLQPGTERRRTSSHYTPRSLSAPIVRRTLEPLLAVMGDAPPSERILNLKVCDPAMGSGAFLVEACRFLADHVVAAWTREGATATVARDHGDPVLHARRLVAQRCLYGVDKNEAAVELAKLSLWLVTLARDLPFTFVDHALRHGDSLVGLDFDQVRSFHWKPGKQLELFTREVSSALDEAIALRQKILDLAASRRVEDVREKERLLWDSQDALNRVRLIADVCVGAFFAKEKDKEREKERVRRLDLVSAWLKSDETAGEELRAMQSELRARVPAFHWHVEFPEVFYAERPDPLDEDRCNGAACMDAFVGNPPFAGGLTVSGLHGNEYLEWGRDVLALGTGKADLSAYFFRRAEALLGRHGTIGLIATNSIAQADTREAALAPLLAMGLTIYDATRSMAWPGDAAVAVAVVHLAKGNTAGHVGGMRLDGVSARTIDSFLRERSERTAPMRLPANEDIAFAGAILQGAGFVVATDDRERLIRQDARNAARLRPYIGGDEVNSNPTQAFERYVITFGQLPLEEAAEWPDLIGIVRARVKPEREKLRDDQATARMAKARWWQFWAPRVEKFDQLARESRCLVAARVTKHLCFTWVPTNWVFSEQLYVFPLPSSAQFAILQSRVHERWARLLSSSLEDRLRYSASDCFDTFPFPRADPRAAVPALESIGERLYTARASYMIDNNVGLTITYNRLKDPGCTNAPIAALRTLHEEMDRAVLDAYGWSDIAVPPFCIATDADKKAPEKFESEVIDRLFALNAKRAEEEKLRGLGTAPKGASGARTDSIPKRRKAKAGSRGGGNGPGLPGVE